MSIMFVVSCLKLPLQLQSAPSPHHCNPQQRMRTARTWCLTDRLQQRLRARKSHGLIPRAEDLESPALERARR
ncbi:hypothetical protein K456DRAFT_47233 [Colletotrichum gloeosporioides 23]|nr:hypothetical protein K456DRAFT_47233 [Colletotrichum gloeosporioides 23]